ncbi:hypothetical protein Pcinc_020835, partial [Petrolisthes cinctipes]
SSGSSGYGSPGPVMEAPGSVLETPGLVLEPSESVLKRPGLVLETPGQVLETTGPEHERTRRVPKTPRPIPEENGIWYSSVVNERQTNQEEGYLETWAAQQERERTKKALQQKGDGGKRKGLQTWEAQQEDEEEKAWREQQKGNTLLKQNKNSNTRKKK